MGGAAKTSFPAGCRVWSLVVCSSFIVSACTLEAQPGHKLSSPFSSKKSELLYSFAQAGILDEDECKRVEVASMCLLPFCLTDALRCWIAAYREGVTATCLDRPWGAKHVSPSFTPINRALEKPDEEALRYFQYFLTPKGLKKIKILRLKFQAEPERVVDRRNEARTFYRDVARDLKVADAPTDIVRYRDLPEVAAIPGESIYSIYRVNLVNLQVSGPRNELMGLLKLGEALKKISPSLKQKHTSDWEKIHMLMKEATVSSYQAFVILSDLFVFRHDLQYDKVRRALSQVRRALTQ